jgi:hypothetical protein
MGAAALIPSSEQRRAARPGAIGNEGHASCIVGNDHVDGGTRQWKH